MCGVVGVVGYGLTGSLERAIEKLHHRGPDASGTWRSPSHTACLGHTRLAILDLSEAGQQPMVSRGGRYAIVFNGEIYNHAELRHRLVCDGHRIDWLGHSDTETLLAAIEAWGVRDAVSRAVGMFAFGVWDESSRCITIARDRLGEKPLYYSQQGGLFIFASELKAILAISPVRPALDRTAVTEYLRLGYIPAPRSIWTGVSKLIPGTTLTATAGSTVMSRPEAYWSLPEVIGRGIASPFNGSALEAMLELDRLILRSVSLQQQADVPVGVFLSGGIDSSAIASALVATSTQQCTSVTAGSTDSRFDESAGAAAIAGFLGTNHHARMVAPQDILDMIPRLATVFDEPFADYSQLPTMLVSEWAREHVKVCLTGDGGDELFGGYNRHVWASRLSALPASVRRVAALGLGQLSGDQWDCALDRLSAVLPNGWRIRLAGDKARKLRRMLQSGAMASAYDTLITAAVDLSHEGTLSARALCESGPWNELEPSLTDLDRMMAIDTMSYLPDDILCKVDRSSMAVSLETRAPLLDHRIVEFAWTLPGKWKVRGLSSKWILKRVLQRRVPRDLWDRPKTGFGVPLGEWLRGPLRDWAEQRLAPGALAHQDLMSPEAVRRCWNEHLSRRHDWSRELWTALMLQDWQAEWLGRP